MPTSDQAQHRHPLREVTLLFLRLGLTAFGGPAAHIAMFRDETVERRKWVTDQHFLDLLGGVPGALLGTLGIFLPSFVFVTLSNPVIPRVRNSPWASGLLDGVNVASLGLMAAVTLQLSQAALIDPLTVVLALAALGLSFRFKVNSAWLVIGGGLVGWVSAVLQ
jgi:chromate transporter